MSQQLIIKVDATLILHTHVCTNMAVRSFLLTRVGEANCRFHGNPSTSLVKRQGESDGVWGITVSDINTMEGISIIRLTETQCVCACVCARVWRSRSDGPTMQRFVQTDQRYTGSQRQYNHLL